MAGSINEVQRQMAGSLYYEETATLAERLFIVAFGFILSPLLAKIFHIIATVTFAWLWPCLVVAAIFFLMFHIVDAVMFFLRILLDYILADRGNNDGDDF